MHSEWRTPAALLALALAAAPWSASAESQPKAADVGDWALPNSIAAVTFRGADGLADRLDALEARFGAAPAVAAAAAELRGWTAEGVGPWARSWGPGLDLGAGVGLFIDAGQRVRLVIGSTDAAESRATLARWIGLAELPLTPTADGFEGPAKVSCAQRARFLVCDSQAVPEVPEGGGTTPGDGIFDARLSGPLLAMLPPPLGLWAEHIEMHIDADDHGAGVVFALKTREDARPQLDPIRAIIAPEGASSLAPLHPRSPLVAKFSVDGAALMKAVAPDDPQAQALAARIGGAWSGDVLMTVAGGLGDPIVALGLSEGADGPALVDALIELLAEADLKLEHRRGPAGDGAVVLRDADAGGAEVTVRYRATGAHLTLALESIDLDRVLEDDTPPPGMPPALARRGVHGVYLAHLPSGIGALPRLVEFEDADARLLSALSTLAQLEAKLLDGAALWIEPGPDTLRVELRWSRL